jgi:hypothetical protein
MPAPTIAAIPAPSKKAGLEDIETVLQIIVFAFEGP